MSVIPMYRQRGYKIISISATFDDLTKLINWIRSSDFNNWNIVMESNSRYRFTKSLSIRERKNENIPLDSLTGAIETAILYNIRLYKNGDVMGHDVQSTVSVTKNERAEESAYRSYDVWIALQSTKIEKTVVDSIKITSIRGRAYPSFHIHGHLNWTEISDDDDGDYVEIYVSNLKNAYLTKVDPVGPLKAFSLVGLDMDDFMMALDEF